MNVHPVSNANFRAVPFAEYKVKGINSCYKLYKINSSDIDFLYDMYERTDLTVLMPKLEEHEYMNWSGLLESAIDSAKNTFRKTFFETCDDKPCGIMNFSKVNDNCSLNYIVTFPVEPEKKVPFAGQILFNALFKHVLDSKLNGIELTALKYTPFDPVSKYLKLGFRCSCGDNWTEDMKINMEGIKTAISKQSSFITSTFVQRQKNVDLAELIKLQEY